MHTSSTKPSDSMNDAQQSRLNVLKAFTYQHATVSRDDIVSRHVAAGGRADSIDEAIQHLTGEQLLEEADEAGRLRLTPQGRRVWRETLGHA